MTPPISSALRRVICSLVMLALGCDASSAPTPQVSLDAVLRPPDVAVIDVLDTAREPADSGGASEDSVGASEDSGGASEDGVGASEDGVGASEDSTRASEDSVGASEDSVGVSEDTSDASGADVHVDIEAPEAIPPELAYASSNSRTLLFSNNPEQIITTDLGDAALGDKTLYRATATGPCRSFFEHVNRANRTIGFGIQAYNPGPTAVTVAVHAAGWVASIGGGTPFADAFNGVGATPNVTLGPGASTWLFRRDEAVTHNTFFSGVVDFDVAGGAVILNHIAYDTFAALDGSTSDLGYVQRVEPDGTHEARMYKGVATASEVTAALAFSVDDATPIGALPIRAARYVMGAGYTSANIVRNWTTHIGPAQNAGAITSDMVAFNYAPWSFDPFAPSDGEGRYPNLGNWGVVYRLRVRVTNDGTNPRTVAYRVTASPGAGAGLAAQVDAAPWRAYRLEKGVALDLGAVTVPAGATRELAVSWVLGGPSGGGLNNELRVD